MEKLKNKLKLQGNFCVEAIGRYGDLSLFWKHWVECLSKPHFDLFWNLGSMDMAKLPTY